MPETREVVWKPQPGPQTALVTCPVFDVLYGGARGGGKTDAMLGDWLQHSSRYGEHARGIFFRRELPQLKHVIKRSQELFFKLGAKWYEQDKRWRMPNGAELLFRPLERESDAEKYQGHEYTRVYFEELTNWPGPGPIDRMKATLRSAHGVPVGIRSTANPGGPGHTWVKHRYIDPAPGGYKVIDDEMGQRVFIPAKLQDNRILLRNDPKYAERLKLTGPENLVRAWLEGDWNIVEGAYFTEWSEKIVIEPFSIPIWWTRFRSLDWGSARPFSVGWWAVSDGSPVRCGGKERVFPRGAMIRYREWYGASAPNVGLKMTAEEVAQGIVEMEGGEKILYSVADPAIFASDGGPSIAERMENFGVFFEPADNSRVPRYGRMGGWDQLRARMRGVDGEPMIYCFNTCRDSIRTIPTMQHDARRPEDIDTNAEDHAADEWRYACMSRPMVVDQMPKVVPFRRDYGEARVANDTWRTV